MSEAYAILIWIEIPHIRPIAENHIGSVPISTDGKAIQDLVGIWWESYLKICILETIQDIIVSSLLNS